MGDIEWPELPEAIDAPAGPVKVLVVRNLRNTRGKPLQGQADPMGRTIEIEATLPPEGKWSVFFHEWAHFVFFDSGLGNLVKGKKLEAVCDAIASARMVEKFGERQDPSHA